MYLSRVRLHPSMDSTQLASLLRDRKGYGLHRLFWGLFDSKKRNFLFREELAAEQLTCQGKRRADPLYYLLSAQEPQQDSPLLQVESKRYEPKLSTGDRLSFKLRVNAVVSRNGKRHDIVMDTQRSWLQQELAALNLSGEGDKGSCKRRLLEHADDTRLIAWKSQIEKGPFGHRLEYRLKRSELLEWAMKTAVEVAIFRWWLRQGERHGFGLPENETSLQAMAYQKHHLPEKNRNAGFNSLDLSGEVIVRDVDKFKELLFDGTGPAKAFGCGLMMIRRV
ncbi:type I-E CRISPR-associated protein Cas6/Cse3/CasE [Motiliproteus sp. MSK22-1]|uniref:type I-E CRISPR-associated protein Cas6/Cse3/CasE n=1 Tax=Motiliproteus sp. MSK22-1 TaxID=1897630 RepID=UPI000977BCC0|nr:type I-E CRISPR-associated protein Cas6/Cse3/CasE [Motiliproteus sp. MSK22-1]OMH30528.1 hypothetical protein BGP75_17465 [Motiliproteus sp. MSK22-1]